MQRLWTTRSLRFWIAFGMTLALGPLAVSAVLGYLWLDRGVIASFHDVADRQRGQIDPTQHLRLLIWEAVVPVDEFANEGNPAHLPAYRTQRESIEAGFANLHQHLDEAPELRALVERARDDWTAADRLATELISVRLSAKDSHAARLMERFHGQMAAAIDKLGAVDAQLDLDIERDHVLAVRAYRQSVWMAVLAGSVSLLALVVGVVVIGHVIAGNVDRLVDGAARFAAGDRMHRIDIPAPPELHRVAEEFNRMIRRIRESEDLLASQARRDGLTGLLNRRAFDEAIEETYARIRRLGEHAVLMMVDIDYFKRVNDSHGHAAGDDVLRAVAQTLASGLRPFDRVFRIGGEEFAVLLPGVDLAAARATAERLRRAVAANAVQVNEHEVTATLSIGVAAASESIEPSALIEAADAALYRAKAAGRNRVELAGGACTPEPA